MMVSFSRKLQGIVGKFVERTMLFQRTIAVNRTHQAVQTMTSALADDQSPCLMPLVSTKYAYLITLIA